MNDKELQSMVNRLVLYQTIEMTQLLAKHFTLQTKIVLLPIGTTKHYVMAMPKREYKPFWNLGEIEKREVAIQSYFGTMVGYDIETDTLFYWMMP
jgi:hypothetical protein